MSRQTVNVNGTVYCADLSGQLPGTLTIANATLGPCAVDPPPGNDPLDIELVNIQWRSDGSHVITDARDFRNLARLGASRPPIEFPFARSATFVVPFAPGRHWRSKIIVPINPALSSYRLKAISYGSTPGRTINAAIVLPGTNTPISPSAHVEGRAFSDSVLFDITTNPEDLNQTRVKLTAGMVVEVLVTPVDTGSPMNGCFMWA